MPCASQSARTSWTCRRTVSGSSVMIHDRAAPGADLVADDHPLRNRPQRLPDQLVHRTGPAGVRGVEERACAGCGPAISACTIATDDLAFIPSFTTEVILTMAPG